MSLLTTSLAVLASTLSLAATAGPAAATAPNLHVDANQLVDNDTGQQFVPRGVNWPSFEYACFYGYGYSNAASDTQVGPDDQDAANMEAWHINTVRVPLNQDCWLGDDGAPSSDGSATLTVDGYRQAVEDWVETLHRHGMAVILDLHWSGPDGVAAEGQFAMADERSPDFWASVAETFQGDSAVMFDAFNEPYSRDDAGFDLTWDCWRDGGCEMPRVNENTPDDGNTSTVVGMQALVDAIRGAGATQPILLAGRDYANDLSQWLESRPGDDQLVASFHNYPGQPCDAQDCWDTQIAAVAAQVPVVTTEIGDADCSADHLTRYMDWADQNGVGYLAWEWILPDDGFECGSQSSGFALIADTQGTPQEPVGTALKEHLDALGG
jgi:hypothetical protein